MRTLTLYARVLFGMEVQLLSSQRHAGDTIALCRFYWMPVLALSCMTVDASGDFMIRVLVAAGADPNQELDQFNTETPLTIAIKEGYTEIVEILTGTTN